MISLLANNTTRCVVIVGTLFTRVLPTSSQVMLRLPYVDIFYHFVEECYILVTIY